MSVFGNIMNRIFHRNRDAEANASTGAVAAGPAAEPVPREGGAASGSAPAPAASAPAPAAAAPVDVEAVLTDLASRNPQKLNWRTSIVDLMKLLDLDSSLAQRKELATELGYTGAKDGSAEMNLWLHRQVMNKLAANGGKVPADLRD